MQVISYQLPSPLPPPEIVAKFCVTLVHLRSDTQFSHLINALDLDVESYGDLYLDISEALIQEKYNQHAMEVIYAHTIRISCTLCTGYMRLHRNPE